MVIETLKKNRKFGLGTIALASAMALSACAADATESDEAVEGEQVAGDEEVTTAEATRGTTIATVGDSWMNNTLGTGGAVDGALGRAGVRHDNYAVQGVMLLTRSLFGASITSQVDSKVVTRSGKSQYKQVVITGGGNDIIQNAALERSCSASSASSSQFATCAAKLTEIRNRMVDLWGKMGKAGVEEVIYIAYSPVAGSAPLAASSSAEALRPLCAAQTGIHCTFIETKDIVRSKADLIADGIHPKRNKNDEIAAKVIRALKDNNETHEY